MAGASKQMKGFVMTMAAPALIAAGPAGAKPLPEAAAAARLGDCPNGQYETERLRIRSAAGTFGTD
jgi:hypothetical protein